MEDSIQYHSGFSKSQIKKIFRTYLNTSMRVTVGTEEVLLNMVDELLDYLICHTEKICRDQGKALITPQHVIQTCIDMGCASYGEKIDALSKRTAESRRQVLNEKSRLAGLAASDASTCEDDKSTTPPETKKAPGE